MKSVNRICLMMILCCVCCINIAQAAVNPKPFVIPELKEWKGNEGKFILPNKPALFTQKEILNCNASPGCWQMTAIPYLIILRR